MTLTRERKWGWLPGLAALKVGEWEIGAGGALRLNLLASVPTEWGKEARGHCKLEVAQHDASAAFEGRNQSTLSENVGAHAGFLEFKGDGLQTFERAQAHDEQLLAVLGSRLLEMVNRGH